MPAEKKDKDYKPVFMLGKKLKEYKIILKNERIKLDMDYIKNWSEKHRTIDKLNYLFSQINSKNELP